MKKFDVIIAGGGMAGATAALALSQLSLNIALIESIEPKNSSPSFDQRAVALSAASVAIFKTLGIWSKIQPLACPITDIHISDQGHFGATRLHASDYNFDALGQVIPLDQTGPILWQEMQATDNIELFCPSNIVSIDDGIENNSLEGNCLKSNGLKSNGLKSNGLKDEALEDKKKIKSQITVCLNSNSNQQKISAKLLLAADGTFSSVAKMASIATDRDSYQQHAVIANISTEIPHDNRAFERFTKQGPLALLPLTQSRMSLVWCQSEESLPRVMSYSDDEFIEQLQIEFGYRLGLITKVGERAEYPLALHLPKQAYAERVLLLGNSAHTLHPIAGQGFNLGLRDIAALCDAIQQAKKCNQDIGSQQFLESYQAQRLPDWQQTTMATDTLVRLFSSDFLPLVMARNKALSLLNKLPFAKEKLAMAAMGFSGESAQLTRGIGIKSHTFTS